MDQFVHQQRNRFAGYGILIAVLAFVAGIAVAVPQHKDSSGISGEEQSILPSVFSGEDDECNAIVFALNGFLNPYMPTASYGYEGDSDVSSSEVMAEGLYDIAQDENIKAVIMTVDSGGGYGVAGEEVAQALKNMTVPTAAVIRSLGASAAYLAASGADVIFASPFSDVGGIGITASFLDESKKNEKDGYTYVELTSGRFKDMGNPSKPLTDEEKAVILADIAKNHEYFVDLISQNRGIDRARVSEIATGQTFVGTDALSLGLVDRMGGLHDAQAELEAMVGEPLSLCWY